MILCPNWSGLLQHGSVLQKQEEAFCHYYFFSQRSLFLLSRWPHMVPYLCLYFEYDLSFKAYCLLWEHHQPVSKTLLSIQCRFVAPEFFFFGLISHFSELLLCRDYLLFFFNCFSQNLNSSRRVCDLLSIPIGALFLELFHRL